MWIRRTGLEHAPAKKVEIVRHARNKTVCADALGINRKNIYRQRRQPLKDLVLKQQIEAVHREHPAYGHRRIAYHLGINHKRVQRVMALFKLRPPRRTTRPYSTRSTTPNNYPNLLKDIETITQPHQVWCSDLSRFVYRGTVWYLATIEDIATRQIVAHRLEKQLGHLPTFSTTWNILRHINV